MLLYIVTCDQIKKNPFKKSERFSIANTIFLKIKLI